MLKRFGTKIFNKPNTLKRQICFSFRPEIIQQLKEEKTKEEDKVTLFWEGEYEVKGTREAFKKLWGTEYVSLKF
jgi:hypothetical protein